MKPIARMIVTLTMRGIRAWGINHAAGRYSYQCSIIGWVEFLSRWWWPQDTTKRDWCCQSCVVLPKKLWFYYIEKRFVPPPELVSGQSSDSSSAWVPRRIGAVWRWFLIVVIDFKFRAHKITTYTEKRQKIIGKIWGRRNFFFKIYRTITDHSGRLHYRLGGEGEKVKSEKWKNSLFCKKIAYI